MPPASAAVRAGAPAEQPSPASDQSRVLGFLRRHRVGAAAGALVFATAGWDPNERWDSRKAGFSISAVR